MNTETAGRVVGGLFLSAFFLYGGGTFLVTSTTDGGTALPGNAASLGQLAAGSGLLLLNSAAVTTIGVLAFRVLRRRHHRTATTYLTTRLTEAALLAAAPLATLTLVMLDRPGADGEGSGLAGLASAAVKHGETSYWLAMATLGVGSIAFCRTLLKSGLLPRYLALGGIVGYAVFALGSVLELAGYPVGLALSAPGGLFEVAAGSYLLVKGFRTTHQIDDFGDARRSGRAAAVAMAAPHAHP